MALQVEFKDSVVESFSGKAKKTGNDFHIDKQTCYLHGSDAYPQKTEVVLKDANKPFAPGMYQIDVANSVYVDRNGRMAFSPVLIASTGK